MRISTLSTLVAGLGFLIPALAHAAPTAITYSYDHHIFTVSVTAHTEWRQPVEKWYFSGVEAVPPARFLSCGTGTIIDPGWTKEESVRWDEDAIAASLAKEIASKFDRPAGSVVISRTATGMVIFDGIGLTGRAIDLPLAASMTKSALEDTIAHITLPVSITDPSVTVNDPELKAMGIKEVVTVGESVFAKSPVNRRHNIAVGFAKFNRHLIPKDSVFSFVEILGKVDFTTGYWKELVINGDTTVPDYGGGLCQVSTTAYRGPWEYGMPILQRKNHSYAVSYYSPQGTDATVYPPNIDIKFKNDTPGALLIQTYLGPMDHAYFIYYGTKDSRASEVFGPFIFDRVSASREEKIVYTTDIPPGEKRKAGERHDGLKAVWYREVQMPGSGATLERVFSWYEARPLTWQIGVSAEDKAKLTPGAASGSSPVSLLSTQ